MMSLSIRLLILPLCLFGAVQGAAAQRLSYHGIAWDVPAESVRPRLQALGFTFRGVMEGGDHQFTRDDGAWLQAQVRDGRVIGFTQVDPVRGEGVDERFRALEDSLRAELGPPHEVEFEGQPPLRVWDGGLSSVRVEVSRASGQRTVNLAWRGPGWFDEMDRRTGRAPPPAGYTTVNVTPFLRIAVDTTMDGPAADGALRGRFRIEYVQPITPSVAGVAQEPLDAVEYEMEFDCAGRRARLISRSTWLDGRRQREDRPRGQPWTTVREPGTHYARGLHAVCRAAAPER